MTRHAIGGLSLTFSSVMTWAARSCLLLLVTVLASLSACSTPTIGSGPNSGGEKGSAEVAVSALVASAVANVSLRIEGPGISPPIVATLARREDRWGIVVDAIPAGSARTFSISAKSSSGEETYRGRADNVTITAGKTTTVLIVAQQVRAPERFSNAAPVIDGLSLSSTRVGVDDAVEIQLTAHDPDPGDSMTVGWSASQGTFTAPNAAATKWVSPGVEGTFRISVRVRDTKGASAALSVDIDVAVGFGRGGARVDVRFNNSPAVLRMDADPARLAVDVPVTVLVDASDRDADPIGYAWSSDCAGTFGNAHAAQSTFVLATNPASATCKMTVAVDDGRGGNNTGVLVLPVGDPRINRAPVIVEARQSIGFAAPGDTVTFVVSSVDPDGEKVTSKWTASGGSFDTPSDQSGTSTVTWKAAPGDGPLARVRVEVADAAGLVTSQNFEIEVALSWCPPFGSSCANADETCVSVALDNSTGTCLLAGAARDGDSCAPSLGSTGCMPGYSCVTFAGANVCRKDCDVFAAASECPTGQRCSVDGVCSSLEGDEALFGGLCDDSVEEGTSCAADGGRWRGVCVREGVSLRCAQLCRFGVADCGGTSRQCVEAFEDGLQVGVCRERGSCGDGGPEHTSCDECLRIEARECCSSESAACTANPACTALASCIQACGASDDACRDACVTASPDGVPLLEGLTKCLQGSIREEFVGACGAICR